MKPRRERFYPLTVLLFSLGYLSYFLSKAVFVVCAVPLVLVLAPCPRVKYRVLAALTQAYLRCFTRVWLPALGVYRILEISGREAALARRPAVIVANHRGFMDSLLLLGLLPRTGVLIKARDTRQVMYGLLARHFDLVSVDRRALSSVSASLAKGRALLAAGKNLLVYPEGTRARTGRLQRFNPFAFRLALESRAPVVPVIIHSTRPFMAKVPGSMFPRGRNEYRIRFLDPEWPRADDAAESLSERVYRRMARELKPLDAGTCWDTGTLPPHE